MRGLVAWALLVAAGCNGGDALVVVSVRTDDEGVAARTKSLRVDVSAYRNAQFKLTGTLGIGVQEATFAMEIPAFYSGRVTVGVAALDADRNELAFGDGEAFVSSGTRSSIELHLRGTAPFDASVPRDLQTFTCGGAVCGSGTRCCVTTSDGGVLAGCATGCDDGGVWVACVGPQQCGGNPCCATYEGTVNADVSCRQLPFQCTPALSPDGGQTRLCNGDSDCTDGVFTELGECCTETIPIRRRICFNSIRADSVPGMTCP